MPGRFKLPAENDSPPLPSRTVRTTNGMVDCSCAEGHAADTAGTSVMTGWCVIRLAKGLGEHAPVWDALNQSLFNNHPMLGSR